MLNYFFAAIPHVDVNYDSPCVFFCVGCKTASTCWKYKNNIQKLAVDDMFPIGVILIGRESMIDRILSTFHMPISYQ